MDAGSSNLEGLCLGQVAVGEDSNEITAVPVLPKLLEISEAIVTLDALHCQKETARAIRDKGADYLLTVKGNQPELKAVIECLFERHAEKRFSRLPREDAQDSRAGTGPRGAPRLHKFPELEA